MTLEQYLEQDKEKLLQQLKQADTPENSLAVLEAQMDRLMLKYNEDTEHAAQRSTAAAMLQTSRTALPLISCLGTPELWQKNTDTRQVSGIKKAFNSGWMWTAAGCLCLIILVFSSSIRNVLPEFAGIQVHLLFAAAGGACLFAGGRMTKKRIAAISSENNYMVTNHIDADRIYQTLRALVLIADRNLQEIRTMPLSEATDPAAFSADTDLRSDEIALFSELMEALYSGDGAFALIRLENLRYYLHTKNIQTVDYTEKHENWFDHLPASAGPVRTIRPALVRQDKLLVKGLAAGGNEHE